MWTGCIVGILIIVLIILGQFYPQTYLVAYSKFWYRESRFPYMYVTPVPREINQSIKFIDYQDFSVLSLEFKVPWLENVNTKEIGEDKLLKFDGSRGILVLKNAVDLREMILEQFSEQQQYNNGLSERILGDSIKSRYEFNKAILNVTPNQIKLSDSRNEISKKWILITAKLLSASMLVKSGEKIYNFETPTMRGFQFGDPPNVILSIFDNSDHQYDLLISGSNQDEIDFILSFIKPASNR